ncbi:lysis system i-spanin subunit Rz [Comamonas sp. NoAH]|uniref:lysis system i-spanin subunit Rz n=1 Tax=Comamonas halotolerans TaxID=3041496 RepID=UPI0024E10E93|nr:lysis system i-spanin subunit Rz [Comamonas sp. NoAH]
MNAATLIPMLARLLLPLAAVAILYGVDQRAEQRGRLDEQARQAAQHADVLSRNIQQSNRLAGVLGQFIEQHQQEQFNAQEAVARLGTDLRSGAIRLHVRTTHAPSAGGNTDRAAAGTVQAHTELDPADAAALLHITAQGDDAIRELNTCIDRYHAVQQTLSATP